MDWVQILVNLILTGVLLYAFQKTIDERAEKRLEKFKAEIRSVQFEKEIKFSKLHEKRLEVVAEIYKKLLMLYTLLNIGLVTLNSSNNKVKKIDVLDKTMIAEGELRDYFEENRLYLPKNICNKIDEILDYALNTNFVLFTTKSKGKAGEKGIENEEHRARLKKGLEIFLNKVKPLKEEIENEFRSLVED